MFQQIDTLNQDDFKHFIQKLIHGKSSCFKVETYYLVTHDSR